LRSAGCAPGDVAVEIQYVERGDAHWAAPEFDLQFERVAGPEVEAAELASQPRPIEIKVVRGVMERWSYSLAAARIDVGRGAEVRDSRNRLIRTNQVVFSEGADAVNQTVSRKHAHITYEPHTGAFRLHDDDSEHGTEIVRDGRTISVLRGTRGVRLQADDEVVLGEARVRIKFPKR